jgi:DNA-binding PadR family transcriptional regulator
MSKKHPVPTLSLKEATILGTLLLMPAEEMYGLQIVDESQGLLKRGTIYVTLQRMEEKKVIQSRQEERTRPEVGIARRVYTVTGLGVRALRQYEQNHNKLSRLISVTT